MSTVTPKNLHDFYESRGCPMHVLRYPTRCCVDNPIGEYLWHMGIFDQVQKLVKMPRGGKWQRAAYTADPPLLLVLPAFPPILPQAHQLQALMVP